MADSGGGKRPKGLLQAGGGGTRRPRPSRISPAAASRAPPAEHRGEEGSEGRRSVAVGSGRRGDWWEKETWGGEGLGLGERCEGLGERRRGDRRLGFSTRGVQLIYNRREMTILPLELDEITGPATARKNGRPR